VDVGDEGRSVADDVDEVVMDGTFVSVAVGSTTCEVEHAARRRKASHDIVRCISLFYVIASAPREAISV
jgi:hypothetical protein